MNCVWRGLTAAFLIFQSVLAARVAFRLLRTARGRRIEPVSGAARGDRTTVIVPVLNETHRLAPCLEGLLRQGSEVEEILVVDGGSTDGTPDLVATFARRDPRIRSIASPPLRPGDNGKAHNLRHGLAHASPETTWVLTIDADVRPGPGLAAALLAHAHREVVPALSAATRQQLSGAAEGLLHPAMLTTLVYRFGIPGHATNNPARVQANGQCFLVQRDVLLAAGGFSAVLDSVCEDVTLARLIAANGHRVGFYETTSPRTTHVIPSLRGNSSSPPAGTLPTRSLLRRDDTSVSSGAHVDLVRVAMYAAAGDAWRNWLRSLPMRDHLWSLPGWLGLAEIVLVQSAPLPLAILFGRRSGWAGLLGRLNLVLLVMRLGALFGMARAYVSPPWTYWLSPMSDLPVALGVLLSAKRRVHSWRGQPLVRGESR